MQHMPDFGASSAAIAKCFGGGKWREALVTLRRQLVFIQRRRRPYSATILFGEKKEHVDLVVVVGCMFSPYIYCDGYGNCSRTPSRLSYTT